MNDTDFSFIGLVKLNSERPILGTNPSSLKFVKYESGLVFRQAISSVCYPLLTHKTEKKALIDHDGGNEKGIILQIMVVVCHYL